MRIIPHILKLGKILGNITLPQNNQTPPKVFSLLSSSNLWNPKQNQVSFFWVKMLNHNIQLKNDTSSHLNVT